MHDREADCTCGDHCIQVHVDHVDHAEICCQVAPDGSLQAPMRLHRFATAADLAEIAEIDQASFEAPYTHHDLVAALRHPRHVLSVIEERQSLLERGSVVAWSHCVLDADALRVATLAVHPERRRQGLASELIDGLTKRYVRQGIASRMLATVRERNVEAQHWLHKLGFRCVKVTRDTFGLTGDDFESVYLFRASWLTLHARMVDAAYAGGMWLTLHARMVDAAYAGGM